MIRPLIISILALLALLVPARAVATETQRKRAWMLVQQEEWESAQSLFEKLISQADQRRARQDRFGLALCALNRQPRSANTLDNADRLFAQLAEAEPDDQIGIASQYYRIRIGHVFALNRDLEASRHAYKALYDSYPDAFYGQQACVRHVILTAFAKQPVEHLRAALPDLEKRIRSLDDDSSRRDASLALAQAYLVIVRDKRAALRWFKVADKAGLTFRKDSRRPYLSAAGAAWDLRNWKTARHFYERFLSLNTRDDREAVVRLRLDAIESIAAGERVDIEAVP